MDQRDEFSKWMETVEDALVKEGMVELGQPADAASGECGCGCWDCEVCFPPCDVDFQVPLDHAAMHSSACPTCGHEQPDTQAHRGMNCATYEENQDDMDLVTFEMEEGADDTECSDQAYEKPQSGSGIKLGNIVQKYIPANGDKSPLTYGSDNLEEVAYGDEDQEPDLDADPMAAQEYYKTMMGSPKTEADVEEAMEMMSSIKYMQDIGLSKSSQVYTEEEMSNMGMDDLKSAYAEVTGNVTAEGTMTMENVDKDIAAMLATLKKYDTLVESVAPVLGMKTLTMNEKAKPDFLDMDKDGDKKEPMKKAIKDKSKAEVDEATLTELSQKTLKSYKQAARDDGRLGMIKGDQAKMDKRSAGMKQADARIKEEADKSKIPAVKRKETGKPDWKVTQADLKAEKEKNISSKEGLDKVKKDTGIDEAKDEKSKDHFFKKKGTSDKEQLPAPPEEVNIKEGADADVLEWMQRFSKLGNMKGYGR